MKLDVNQLRYLSQEEFRVLTAVEMGMKNHELVPTQMIQKLASLRFGGAKKCLSSLEKLRLIHHDNKKYDGYYLTYPGYDYLALKTFVKRGTVSGVGRQIGVGKESDIYIVINDEEEELVLKCQRLGRTSFRQVRNTRDYQRGTNKIGNWLYISRLGALKEYAFMKALYEAGFPTPTPIDQSRHCVLMSVVPGYPLVQIKQMGHPEKVFKQCIDLIIKFAEYGLIHGDFNEFNLLCNDEEEVFVIDFPQMVSTSHINADMYFNRDVECIHTFFNKRFGLVSDYWPELSDVIKKTDLDTQVSASGFSKELDKELQRALAEQNGEEAIEEEEEIKEKENKKENLIKLNLIPQEKINIDYHQKRNKMNDEIYEKFVKVEFEIPSDEYEISYTEEDIKQKVKRSMKKKNYKATGGGLKKSSLNKGKNKSKEDHGLSEKFWE
eukprot:gene5370-9177_t